MDVTHNSKYFDPGRCRFGHGRLPRCRFGTRVSQALPRWVWEPARTIHAGFFPTHDISRHTPGHCLAGKCVTCLSLPVQAPHPLWAPPCGARLRPFWALHQNSQRASYSPDGYPPGDIPIYGDFCCRNRRQNSGGKGPLNGLRPSVPLSCFGKFSLTRQEDVASVFPGSDSNIYFFIFIFFFFTKKKRNERLPTGSSPGESFIQSHRHLRQTGFPAHALARPQRRARNDDLHARHTPK